MTPNEWWQQVGTLAVPGFNKEAYHLGLIGEVGEVVDLLKKHLYHGHELNRAKLVLELGDAAWYCAALDSSLVEDEHWGSSSEFSFAFLLRLARAAVRKEEYSAWMLLQDLAAHFQISWSEVLQANADKLLTRYPGGVYTQQASIERRDVTK